MIGLTLGIEMSGCVFALRPIAAVAETFEYEVMREINVPSVLHGALSLLGDQLLPHVLHLDWGFRFGGRVINKQSMLAVTTSLGLTAATSIMSNFL